MSSSSDAYDRYLEAVHKAIVAMMSAPPMAIHTHVSPPAGYPTTTNRISVTSGITSSGMHGFSEEGSPGDWDMAIGEVYGYRWWKLAVPAELCGWRLSTSGGQYTLKKDPLQGANNQFWSNGRQEAVCTSQKSYPSWGNLMEGRPGPMEHKPPEVREACGCGFWAYFDPMLDVANVLGGMNGQVPTCSGNCAYIPIFGVVKGTGRVIIGEKGFRSQYADIVGLCVADSTKDMLKWNFSNYSNGSNRPVPNDDLGYLRAALKGQMSMWSGGGIVGGSRGYSYSPGRGTEYIDQASEEDRLYRYASVESVLSDCYPTAKVFCDQADMVKYFPPDKNYGRKTT